MASPSFGSCRSAPLARRAAHKARGRVGEATGKFGRRTGHGLRPVPVSSTGPGAPVGDGQPPRGGRGAENTSGSGRPTVCPQVPCRPALRAPVAQRPGTIVRRRSGRGFGGEPVVALPAQFGQGTGTVIGKAEQVRPSVVWVVPSPDPAAFLQGLGESGHAGSADAKPAGELAGSHRAGRLQCADRGEPGQRASLASRRVRSGRPAG